MLRKLLSVLRDDAPLQQADSDLHEMLRTVEGMFLEANAVYWGKGQSPAERSDLYERDVRVNKLERKARKRVITHLATSGAADVPYGLLLMSVVKDIERLGDYAKNLAAVPVMTHRQRDGRTLPDDDVVGELRQIADGIENLARQAANVYTGSSRERAQELTVEGRLTSTRCDRLVEVVAESDYSAGLAVDLTLAIRFYKRIQGHYLNLLSSVLMPLHKLDYYDEKSIVDS